MREKRMKICNVFLLLTFIFSLQSCVTVRENGSERKEVGADSAEVSSAEEKLEKDFEKIVLRPRDGGEAVRLSEIAAGRPVLLDFTASWCKPCGELTGRLNSLKKKYFAENVLFLMILGKADQLDADHPEPDFPIYSAVDLPTSLAGNGVYPRTLIFDKEGNIVSDTEGLFPSMLYYGVLSDLVTQ